MPWQFWRLTPREFDLMHSGAVRRQKRRWYQLASLGHWLLLPWLDKRAQLTPEKLLGWKELFRDE